MWTPLNHWKIPPISQIQKCLWPIQSYLTFPPQVWKVRAIITHWGLNILLLQVLLCKHTAQCPPEAVEEAQASGALKLFTSWMIPWTVAHQDPLSMGVSRPEHWSGLPLPSPGGLPDPGIEPTSFMSPALACRFFTASATWAAPSLL